VKGSDTQFFALSSHVLGGKHGSVRRGFVTISLYLHSSGNSDECFTAREIGNMDEGVVEGGKKVGDSEDFFALNEVAFRCCGFFTALNESGGESDSKVRKSVQTIEHQSIWLRAWLVPALVPASVSISRLRGMGQRLPISKVMSKRYTCCR
jgi:hypothetical protein